MPATVIVNNMTVVHASSGGMSQIFPDVCKTPAPPAPVPPPIPYPNIAMSSDTAQGSSTVKCDGNPVMIKSSNFKMSSGDEAGVAMGVVSSKIKGKAEPKLFSMDVKFDGENVMRLSDIMLQNIGGGPNTGPATEVQAPAAGMGAGAQVEDPDKREVTDMTWSEAAIVCGDKVTIDVRTSNFKPGDVVPIKVERVQAESGKKPPVHDSFEVPISGDKGKLEWLSVQGKWMKEIDVTGEQEVYKGVVATGKMKMKTVQDVKEPITGNRSAPKYTMQWISFSVQTWAPTQDPTTGQQVFYGWPFAYDAEIKSGVFSITRKMQFGPGQIVPGAIASPKDLRRWKREVENIWNKKWQLHREACQHSKCSHYGTNGCCMFTIHIKWENGGGHGSVPLNRGANHPRGWGGDYWWYSDRWWERIAGNLGEVRAHEFGHLIGMYDEYEAGACYEWAPGLIPSASPTGLPVPGIRPHENDTTSIMGGGTLTYERHVMEYKNWFDRQATGVLGATKLIRI